MGVNDSQDKPCTGGRCPTADRLRADWYRAKGADLKQYYLNLLNMHVGGCGVCRERMRRDTEAAREAVMPEMEE